MCPVKRSGLYLENKIIVIEQFFKVWEFLGEFWVKKLGHTQAVWYCMYFQLWKEWDFSTY